MFFDPIDIPDELLEAQEEGKLVIFAGAGVSMGAPSNLPSFKGLAAEIAGSHPLAAEIDRYDDRLDRFLGELSRSKVDVQALCRARINNPASKPTDLHRSLVDLFNRPERIRIVTTNFDNHFQSVLRERSWQSDLYFAPALPLGHRFSGVVHLHGWISRQEPLVLTDEDFGRAYLTEGWAREFLQRLFAEFTTLFVGYSHNDLPVEYLARGMSGKSIEPRFALSAVGEAGQWTSLGIQEITFEKTGPNPFGNLYAGIKKWAHFTSQQPTDVAERVKAIVCAPESFAPDKSQSSLLKRCLEREDSCHFFTKEANGWHWVKWLHEQGLLSTLFEPSRRELTNPQSDLAYWLAGALLAEASDEGLLLVEKHYGHIGRCLWSALCRGLWLNDKVDWSSPLIHKWVLLLAETCPADSMGELSHLLRTVARAAPQTLGMALLRRLTALRIMVNKRFDFASLLKGGDTVESKDKAEFEIAIAGEVHELDTVWENCFKPRLSELREPLLLLLENRLWEAHELYRAAERSDATYDPCCSTRLESGGGQGERAQIGDRFDRRLRAPGSFLIPSPRQRGKALRLEDFADRSRAQGELLGFERLADFVNGMVLFAEGDNPVSSGGLLWLGARARAGGQEKARLRVVGETVAQDPEGSWGVAEGAGDLVGGAALDEKGAEGLILAMFRDSRFEEEAARIC